MPGSQLALVGRAEISDGAHGVARNASGGEQGVGIEVFVLGVNGEGVVAFGAHAVVGPTLPAEVAGKAVAVAPQIVGPALAESVHDKAAEVEMAVRGVCVSALEADIPGTGVVKCATHVSLTDACEAFH